MDDTVDLLQIKIERAKEKLPEETSNAIAMVDWKAVILGMRTSKGYDFEQLGDLELETELLLCGLLSPADYPKELEKRMRITKGEANELVNEMNNLVFKKIKEELIKNAERKKIFQKRNEEKTTPPSPAVSSGDINKVDTAVLKLAGIEVKKPVDVGTEKSIENREDILKKVENPEPEKVHPILQQKILGSVQMPTVKTEHTLDNISPTSYPPKKDPYRELPE